MTCLRASLWSASGPDPAFDRGTGRRWRTGFAPHTGASTAWAPSTGSTAAPWVSGLYQKTAAMEVLARRSEAKARLEAAGVLVIDVPPERFSAAVVNQYLWVKERGLL